MKLGTVTGAVRTARKAACLQAQTFLVVSTMAGVVVAADYVGAEMGDKVLVLTGAAAGRLSMEAPADAAVVAILEEKD